MKEILLTEKEMVFIVLLYFHEVMKIKFSVKLVFKVQKQSFADVSQYRRS